MLEDINATLRKSRAPSQEARRMHKEASKTTLDSRKSECAIRRSNSRLTMDQINTPPRSPSRQHLEPRYIQIHREKKRNERNRCLHLFRNCRNDPNPTRHAKFVESTEPHREPSPHPHLSPRRYSLGENHERIAKDGQHQPPKKTSFILGDEDHHVIDIESGQTLDASKTNNHHHHHHHHSHHHPRDNTSGPQEQV